MRAPSPLRKTLSVIISRYAGNGNISPSMALRILISNEKTKFRRDCAVKFEIRTDIFVQLSQRISVCAPASNQSHCHQPKNKQVWGTKKQA